MPVFSSGLSASRLSALRRRFYESVNYRLRFVAGGRFAASCRPVSIVFLLTELCNARCVHCDIWKNKGREQNPSPDDYKRTLTELRQWLGPVQVVFSGGEALLKAFTPELLAHGSSLGFFMEVLTHGYWDDQSKIEKLAIAAPSRITVSLDGIGETHTVIRGRPQFWEKTTRSLETLCRLREEKRLGYAIRLKTVIMDRNLDDLAELARFAARHGMEIFYQAIEQNYNTAEDPRWFEHSDNWPKDPEHAVAKVEELIRLRSEGLPIVNSLAQLEVMIPYFRDPARLRIAVQSHTAHEKRSICSALSTLQIQANGDVTVCTGVPPVGNIRKDGIRSIWEARPQFWVSGCCLETRSNDVNLISIGQKT